MRDRLNYARSPEFRSHQDTEVITPTLKSSEVLSACFEQATVGFSVTDLEGRLLEFNPAYCSIIGYNQAELQRDLDQKTLTHPEDLPSTLAQIDALIAGVISGFVVEARYLHKRGEVVWVQNSVSLIRDNEDRPQSLVWLTQDITERKLTEASLHRAQERNEIILSSVSDVHILFDKRWRFLYVNEAAVDAIRIPREQVLGRVLWDLFPDIIGTELERQYRHAMEQETPVTFRFHYRTTDTWWEIRIYPTPEGLAIFASDITQRKRAIDLLQQRENELAEAQHVATVGTWAWDIPNNTVNWSDELYRIFGLTPQELQASLQAIIERIHPEDRARILATVQACLQTRERFTKRARVVRPDGEQRVVQITGTLICNEYDSPLRLFGLCHDVTELEKTKEAGRAAELKYRQIFENAGEGIFQSTPEGCYLTANPALARIHGFNSPEELIGSCKDISRDIYADPACREEFKRLLEKHGVVCGFEHQTFRKDGSKIWISVNARAVRDETGKILYYEGAAQDITERKQAEQALRESEERYRDLVENSLELICTHDLDGAILSVNRSACEVFGYEPEDFVKKNIRDILAPEVRNQFGPYMTQILEEGGTSGTMLVRTRTGERRLLEYYNSLRTEGIDVPIVRGIARDITDARRSDRALRESEERYRELFENSRDALYVHDMSGRYTSVNRAAESLSGYSRDELIGHHFSNFLNPEHESFVRNQLAQKLEDSNETTYEAEILTKDGRLIPVEISSRLIVVNDVPVAVQGCVRNISERKRTQTAARTYSRRLIEAQEAERRRISRELHDQVGQILTAVKMNLHSLQQKSSDPEILASIRDNMEVIDEAVDQVRVLSVDLRPLLLDDFGLAVALRWYLERQRKNCGIETEFITSSLSEDDRFSSELETACFRIVQEAVTNVIRHANASRIAVCLERSESGLFLSIADDGAGFDMGVLRSSAATLGLRGMEERVQALGGSFMIDSAPALGTEICAHFPARSTQVRSLSASLSDVSVSYATR